MAGREGTLNSLLREAKAASRDGRNQHSAFLYEQALAAAAESGQTNRVFSIQVDAAVSWAFAGKFDRMLKLLLDALGPIPGDAAQEDIYRARKMLADYYINIAMPSLSTIRRVLGDVLRSSETLNLNGADINWFDSMVLGHQGNFEEAYESAEVAWSKRASDGCTTFAGALAARCAHSAIRLKRFEDADRWISLVESDYWFIDAAMRKVELEAELDLGRKNPGSLRSFPFRMSEAADGVQEPNRRLRMAALGIAACCFAVVEVDPESPQHPAQLLLNELSDLNFSPPGMIERYDRGMLEFRLASLRYAVGMPPDVDFFGLPSGIGPARFAARLPSEITPRHSRALSAWRAAEASGRQIDEAYESNRYSLELLNLRMAIDQIGAMYGLQ